MEFIGSTLLTIFLIAFIVCVICYCVTSDDKSERKLGDTAIILGICTLLLLLSNLL